MKIDGKEMVYTIDNVIYHCAMDVTMNFIGGKWKTVVLWYLRNDPKRFSELNRMIPYITEKMLSLQLKQLEKDGLIERKVFAEVPPRVEYTLSEEGKTMKPMLEEIAKWGRYMGKKHGELEESKSTRSKSKQK